MAESANSPTDDDGANVAGRKNSFSKAKAGAIVALIIGIECVMAYRYLPGGDSAPKAQGKKEAAAHLSEQSNQETTAEQREVDLGKFSLTAVETNSNTTLLIEFHLFGVSSTTIPKKRPTVMRSTKDMEARQAMVLTMTTRSLASYSNSIGTAFAIR